MRNLFFLAIIFHWMSGPALFAAPTPTHVKAKTAKSTKSKKGSHMMTIETTYGPIQIEFFPKEAPKTVARITELANQGFYNGLSFHRVIPGFVAQGGDPQGNGTGGSGKKLPAEFNSHKHEKGTVAMARAADPNSADSQFYIALSSIPHLDNQYTVFGKVVKGLDLIDKLKVGDKMVKVYVNDAKGKK